ncbi:MAG: TolC family protein [Planctomycetota bacterium]
MRITLLLTIASALGACTPKAFVPRALGGTLSAPAGAASIEGRRAVADLPGMSPPPPPAPAPAQPLAGELSLDAVLASVVGRYPPYLAKLLQRDIASGRLLAAMGNFDSYLSAKVGGRIQGFYESTVAQGRIEQPLATGDTLYGGYRISDGSLPDYYRDRTQGDGELVFGGRFPLLQNRSIDGRRAGVRIAEISALIAAPEIRSARIQFVREATSSYRKWLATGRKLGIARELLQLANERDAGLRRAVERQFLAPIALIDNERLIAQRSIYVVQAERAFQRASLELSLFLRDDEDLPVVAGEANLPQAAQAAFTAPETSLQVDLVRALRARPELELLQLRIDQVSAEAELAENQAMPQLDVIVEGAASLSSRPYADREDLELFVGGELKVPIQRRKALGRLQQAEATRSRLRIEQRFLRDRISNELLDARSAMGAAVRQIELNERNVDRAEELVTAEQRKFDLGLSDLLNVQLREGQLASARAQRVDARLRFDLAQAAYRAALGYAAE